MALITGANNEFVRTLVSAELYKPGQGQWARRMTMAVFGILIAYGYYSWHITHMADPVWSLYGVPIVGVLLLGWIVFRLVNYPRFADFLITTEAEMKKVHWPTQPELKISTIVVLVNVIVIAIFLFIVDRIWQALLLAIRILQGKGLFGTEGFSPIPTFWMTEWFRGWWF